MSSSSSPCAACRFLRQKCTQECVFAPYFPGDQPEKFVSVHRVFGRSNVAKILKELHVTQREDAVRSLVYEADARLHDPVYGCVSLVSFLQQKLRQLHHELDSAKKELATYLGPQAMAPMLSSPALMPQRQVENPPSSSMMSMPMMGIPTAPVHGDQLPMREPQQQHQHHVHQLQQQIFEAQQEMYRTNYEQQQSQQLHLSRFSSCGTGFEGAAAVTATGFQRIGTAGMSPSLALGTFDGGNTFHVQPQAEQHHQFQEQPILLQPQHAEAQPHPQSQQRPPETQQHNQFGSELSRSS